MKVTCECEGCGKTAPAIWTGYSMVPPLSWWIGRVANDEKFSPYRLLACSLKCQGDAEDGHAEEGNFLWYLNQSQNVATPDGPVKHKLGKPEELSEGDWALYEKLRETRNAYAREHYQQPYTLGTNASLMAIARLKPTNVDELAAIPGFGASRAKKLGADFLFLIEEHLQDSNPTTINSRDGGEHQQKEKAEAMR